MLKVSRLRGALVAAASLAVLVSPVASGAGFSIFEAGSRATAMGGAFVAQADDPSAMFYNPAGLAFQDGGLTVMVGDTLIFPSSKLAEGYAPYPGLGYTAEQKRQIFFPPHLYASAPLGRLRISLGTWFPFGLSTAWENPDDFRGRWLAQRADLRQYALGLQLSGQLAPWISIGGGPELRVSDVKLQRNVGVYDPFTNAPVDAAHLDIVSDGFETDLGWGVGVLMKPAEWLRVGASYHHDVTASYEGDAVFYQRATGNPQLDAAFAARIPVNRDVPVATEIPYPSVFMFGVAVALGDRVTLEADANYWGWSVFEETVLAFGTVDGKTPPTTTLTHDWEDTWALRGGLRFAASPKLDLMAGFVYDQTPQPDEDVSPLLPDANRTGVSLGLSLSVGAATRIELSNLLLFFHDRTTRTNEDSFNARYETTADLVVLSVRSSF